jgi:hypothetical protein
VDDTPTSSLSIPRHTTDIAVAFQQDPVAQEPTIMSSLDKTLISTTSISQPQDPQPEKRNSYQPTYCLTMHERFPKSEPCDVVLKI